MQRIISCSRRTDVPAFYSRWLINRLQAGYCHVVNPFNNRVFEVSLKPDDCLALVFWTRNPAPLLPHLDELVAWGYRYYFHYTIVGYPKALEPHNPAMETSIKTFKRLADRLSADRVRWRYDPIVLSTATPPEYHLRQAEVIASQLEGYTHHCTFSFVNFYNKTKRNLGSVTEKTNITFQQPALAERQTLVRELAQIVGAHGISLNSCCDDSLAVGSVKKNHCIDPDLLQALVPDLTGDLKAEPTRKDCGCASSVDIGAYDTCLFGCEYCYATNSRSIALKRHKEHDPEDSTLWRPESLARLNLSDIAVPVRK